MNIKKWDWSARGWPRVVLGTIGGTLACIAIALFVDSFNFASKTPSQLTEAILVNILLPLGLAGPLLFYFSSKLRELAIANYKMAIIAATDSLTTVLNRGAFTLMVESYLADARMQTMQGALLVVDADRFKSINDAFGHDRGDEALRIIARSIRGVLRGADIVGRLGGEEFGIFLPGSTASQAEVTAERIRSAVNVAEFLPDGTTRHELSVSIGGATFRQRVQFTSLFRLADERLYAAKEQGRNRISMAAMGPVPIAA